MYFFRREKVQCRYQFSLRDAVDLTLLQRALTTALASAPYYTQRLVQEKREMWLEPNTEPCLVYPRQHHAQYPGTDERLPVLRQLRRGYHLL